jgi:hypothetical protein
MNGADDDEQCVYRFPLIRGEKEKQRKISLRALSLPNDLFNIIILVVVVVVARVSFHSALVIESIISRHYSAVLVNV